MELRPRMMMMMMTMMMGHEHKRGTLWQWEPMGGGGRMEKVFWAEHD
jgi:hypothetical protein